jgi:hypothetical protein
MDPCVCCGPVTLGTGTITLLRRFQTKDACACRRRGVTPSHGDIAGVVHAKVAAAERDGEGARTLERFGGIAGEVCFRKWCFSFDQVVRWHALK